MANRTYEVILLLPELEEVAVDPDNTVTSFAETLFYEPQTFFVTEESMGTIVEQLASDSSSFIVFSDIDNIIYSFRKDTIMNMAAEAFSYGDDIVANAD